MIESFLQLTISVLVIDRLYTWREEISFSAARFKNAMAASNRIGILHDHALVNLLRPNARA